MKRLLEWKQRMLQSPLTRKGGGGGGAGARSGSERSTPTLMLASSNSTALGDTSLSSPRLPSRMPSSGSPEQATPTGKFPIFSVFHGLSHALFALVHPFTTH